MWNRALENIATAAGGGMLPPVGAPAKRYGDTPAYDRLAAFCEREGWPVGIARWRGACTCGDLEPVMFGLIEHDAGCTTRDVVLVLEVATSLGRLVVPFANAPLEHAAELLLPHLERIRDGLEDR